jgi:hypothetical protein
MMFSRHSLFAAGLKTLLAVSAICFLCYFTIARHAKVRVDDLWQQLGLTLPAAQLNINYSFINGHLQYFGAKNTKNIESANRVAIVNRLVAYSKKYYGSQEFKTAYKNFRSKARPTFRARAFCT